MEDVKRRRDKEERSKGRSGASMEGMEREQE